VTSRGGGGGGGRNSLSGRGLSLSDFANSLIRSERADSEKKRTHFNSLRGVEMFRGSLISPKGISQLRGETLRKEKKGPPTKPTNPPPPLREGLHTWKEKKYPLKGQIVIGESHRQERILPTKRIGKLVQKGVQKAYPKESRVGKKKGLQLLLGKNTYG